MTAALAPAGNIDRGLLACRRLRRRSLSGCRTRGRIVHPQDGAAVACRIVRGTTGTGTDPGWEQGSHTTPPQVSAATAPRGPKLPKPDGQLTDPAAGGVEHRVADRLAVGEFGADDPARVVDADQLLGRGIPAAAR